MPLLRVGPFSSALDLPEFERGGATEALNVIPRKDSYSPLPSFVAQGGAMASRVMGAAISRGVAGSIKQFAGTETKLYFWDADGNDWTDATGLSGPYSTPSDGQWTFAQFGDDVIATNGVDPVQVFTIGSSSVFEDLAGSPPLGRHVASSRDFVFLGNISGLQNRIVWSAFNDHEDWTQAPSSTQSDIQDLPDGGKVMGLIGGDYIVVLQERNIQVGRYANQPLIWDFQKVAQGIGTPFERAHGRYEDLVFFISEDGFHMLLGGTELRSIGRNRVDREFYNDLDQSKLDRVTVAVDPINRLVVWSYVSTSSSDGEPDKGFIYSWHDDRWARFEQSLEMLHSAVSQAGFTLDDLDAFGDLDSLPFTLDSAFWVGAGRPLLSGFTTAHKIGFFSGPYMAWTVDTSEAEPNPGYFSQVGLVRPMVEGDTDITMRIGHRANLTDDVTWTDAESVNAFGVCPFLVSNRYVRARMIGAAESNTRHILGVDPGKVIRRGRWG